MFRFFSRKPPENQNHLTHERKKELKRLCALFRIHVKNLRLLDRALTHTSYISKPSEFYKTYERLEYLGDAILNAAMGYLLFKMKPPLNEGKLSAYRSSLVDEKTLAEIGFDIGVPEFINLGKGETLMDRRAREKVTADIIEAVIAVYFLEKGFQKTIDLIDRLLSPHLKNRIKNGTQDYKTQLQKISISQYKEYPQYTVVNEYGPDHNKIFEIQVSVDNRQYIGTAKGRTKKEAEQKAAEIVIKKIKQ